MDPVFNEFYRDRDVYGVADDIFEVTTSIGEWFVRTKTLDLAGISHIHVRVIIRWSCVVCICFCELLNSADEEMYALCLSGSVFDGKGSKTEHQLESSRYTNYIHRGTSCQGIQSKESPCTCKAATKMKEESNNDNYGGSDCEDEPAAKKKSSSEESSLDEEPAEDNAVKRVSIAPDAEDSSYESNDSGDESEDDNPLKTPDEEANKWKEAEAILAKTVTIFSCCFLGVFNRLLFLF
ncbi:hypothetical protein C5167_026922 [Papaver somniferum]|nr:hypothetical protein C5167_026922 [Papaver somniferum]